MVAVRDINEQKCQGLNNNITLYCP